MNNSIILAIFCVAIVSAFYEDSDSKVIKLTADNFQSLVLESDELWLVEFYAPWCGHCKKLAPEYDKAAKALNGIVKLGALDMTTDGEAGRPYDVSGYPTLKFFGKDKQTPQSYDGERKKRDIIDFMLDKGKELSLSRLGIEVKAEENNVVQVTDSNFDELVMSSQEPWFIKFYAPWCGHCKKMAPDWIKLSNKVKGEYNIAEVDATSETQLAQRFGVSGYPTLKFFPEGSKSDENVQEYGDDRDLSSFLKFLKKSKSTFKPISLEQLTSQMNFNQQCQNNQCFIAFLPPLAESSNDERQTYINIIQETAQQQKSKGINYLWVQGGDYEELEAELNLLGDGYPAGVLIQNQKNKFYKLKDGFNSQALSQFITNAYHEKDSGYTFSELPELQTVQKWKRDDL